MFKKKVPHFNRRQLKRLYKVLELGFKMNRPDLIQKYAPAGTLTGGLSWRSPSHSIPNGDKSSSSSLSREEKKVSDSLETGWSPAHSH